MVCFLWRSAAQTLLQPVVAPCSCSMLFKQWLHLQHVYCKTSIRYIQTHPNSYIYIYIYRYINATSSAPYTANHTWLCIRTRSQVHIAKCRLQLFLCMWLQKLLLSPLDYALGSKSESMIKCSLQHMVHLLCVASDWGSSLCLQLCAASQVCSSKQRITFRHAAHS